MENNNQSFGQTPLNQPISPSPQPQPKKSHKLAWILGGLVVLILLAIFLPIYNGQDICGFNPASGCWKAKLNLIQYVKYVKYKTREVSVEEKLGYKIYENSQYGFEISIPKDWVVEDSSSSTQNPSIVIKSPARSDLPGYQGEPVYFRIAIVGNVSNTGKIINKEGHFSTIKEVSGQQSAWNVNIDYQTEENTAEYKIGQRIISTFKFTN